MTRGLSGSPAPVGDDGHEQQRAERPLDDGLIQRFQLLVYPDLPKQWRKVDRWPDTQARKCVFEIIRRLTELNASTAGAELDKFDHAQIHSSV